MAIKISCLVIMLITALLSLGKQSRVGASMSSGSHSLNFFGCISSFASSSSSSSSSNDGKLPGNDVDLSTALGYKVVKEELVYDGWRKVIRKEITMPDSKNVKFDVLTQKGGSVTVFIWDSKSNTATLIQEYHPGVNRMMYGTVAGMFESHKHETVLDCAKSELEEEAHLSCDNWYPLLEAPLGVPFEKYSDNMLHAYLALDCKPVLNPKPLDDEEHIIIHRNLNYNQLMSLVDNGELNILSSYTVLMAMKKLNQIGVFITVPDTDTDTDTKSESPSSSS